MITAEEFKAEVLDWAEEVGVEPVELHMRHMTRKLASCSSRGRLTFDPVLLEQDEQERGRAILHELLHLKYPNHGRMHARLVEAYLQHGRRTQTVT